MKIISIKRNQQSNLGFFFKWPFPFSHMLLLFQDGFIFGEATSLHFFRVTTSTQQLLFRSSYFPTAATFLRSSFFKQLFFRNSYLFRAKLLSSSHFLKIGRSLGQLLCRTATFLAEDLFGIKISIEEAPFRSRYFYTASTFSEKLHFRKN